MIEWVGRHAGLIMVVLIVAAVLAVGIYAVV